MKRGALILSAVMIMAFFGTHSAKAADADLSGIKSQIAKQHDRAVQRLQDWIRLPAIAAENRGFPEGAEHMAKLQGFDGAAMSFVEYLFELAK